VLLPIENVLTRDEIVHCRELLARAPWQDGRASAGGLAVHVKANLQLEDSCDVAARIRKLVLARLAGNGTFISAALPKKIFPPKFNCYRNGGHYGLHVDSAIMTLPDTTSLRTDLSATLFLSNPDEYEGGQLTVESQYGVQDIKLAAGDMVLYPSTSLHQVMAVTAGARISCFFWIESLVRDNQQREILFDLDQSIQTLTGERGAGDDEVRRLSGIYHNLLRQWSDT
jgi:PKHD-type hydroxylase